MLPISAFSFQRVIGSVAPGPQAPVLWEPATPVAFSAFQYALPFPPFNPQFNFLPMMEEPAKPIIQELPDVSHRADRAEGGKPETFDKEASKALECARTLTEMKTGHLQLPKLRLKLNGKKNNDPSVELHKTIEETLRHFKDVEARELGKLVVRGPRKQKRTAEFYIEKVGFFFESQLS
ncbi:A6 [Alcelaphine gammaherpesvirus 2]|uniref:A6 n=1 Tax=Alcelaphine gammaherpesvirus 2 TaxID=138184 RepID=A0A068AAL6_9GAMA|nr:A6 [Alcelaphine gammaherpesvirus 2]AIA62086.1 A6 [Alcelaphine gammaherpesvirus 2]